MYGYKDCKPLLFDYTTESIPSGKIDLVLSPSLYWYKKETLPVKFEFQAEKLAPSIFDGMLPEDKEYSYKVIKVDENIYEIFVYCLDDILELFEQKGGDKGNLCRIFFAQNEVDKTAQVKLGEHRCLIWIDEKLSIVPHCLVERTNSIDEIMQGVKLSKQFVRTDSLSSDNTTTLNSVIAVLVFIVLVLGGEKFYLESQLETIDENRNEFISKNRLPQTSLQRKSLEKKYNKIFKEQMQLRAKAKSLESQSNLNAFIKISGRDR